MFMDLHGHSILKNSFLYGPSDTDFHQYLRTFFITKSKSSHFTCGTSPSISRCLRASSKRRRKKLKRPECTFKWRKTSCLLLVRIHWDCTGRASKLFKWQNRIGRSLAWELLKRLKQRWKHRNKSWHVSFQKNNKIYGWDKFHKSDSNL